MSITEMLKTDVQTA